jgi:hypothetical protein
MQADLVLLAQDLRLDGVDKSSPQFPELSHFNTPMLNDVSQVEASQGMPFITIVLSAMQ